MKQTCMAWTQLYNNRNKGIKDGTPEGKIRIGRSKSSWLYGEDELKGRKGKWKRLAEYIREWRK